MSHFGAIWDSIYDGTLPQCWEALITAQQFLILKDAHGAVDMTLQALHRRTGIPTEHLQKGIDWLERENPESRSQEAGGRFIVRINPNRPWGWIVVNAAKFDELFKKEVRNARARERMEDVRARFDGRRTDANSGEQMRTDANSGEQVRGVRKCSPLSVSVHGDEDGDGGDSSLRSSVADSPQGETSAGGSTDPPPISSTSLLELPTKAGTAAEVRPGPPFRITEELVQEYQKLYPTLDVLAELRGMRAWALGHAAKPRLGKLKAYQDVPEFIRNWLDTEAKKRAGPGSGRAAAARAGPPTPARAAPGDDAISQHLRKGKR